LKKAYLISRISKDAHLHNEAISRLIKDQGDEVFVPHQFNPTHIPHREMSDEVFRYDLQQMKLADYAVVSLPIGKDCASEIGWFHGANKPVKVYLIDSSFGLTASEQYESMNNDWMLKGFVTSIVVSCPDLMLRIKKHDQQLLSKVQLLANPIIGVVKNVDGFSAANRTRPTQCR
jgi:nucleoside 2-deoxyribosyltransferase